jgi:hypothetical protein
MTNTALATQPDTEHNGPQQLIENFSDPNRLLTKEETALALRCDPRTLQRYAAKGMPRYGHLYKLSECLAWLRNNPGATRHGKKKTQR